MSADNVVSLRGYIVYVDTYVDVMPGVTIYITLPFGPFGSMEAARTWADELETIFAATHEFEEVVTLVVEDPPDKPYLDVHVTIHMITENVMARKLKDQLFRPEEPAVAGSKLAKYAIEAMTDALQYSQSLMAS